MYDYNNPRGYPLVLQDIYADTPSGAPGSFGDDPSKGLVALLMAMLRPTMERRTTRSPGGQITHIGPRDKLSVDPESAKIAVSLAQILGSLGSEQRAQTGEGRAAETHRRQLQILGKPPGSVSAAEGAFMGLNYAPNAAWGQTDVSGDRKSIADVLGTLQQSLQQPGTTDEQKAEISKKMLELLAVFMSLGKGQAGSKSVSDMLGIPPLGENTMTFQDRTLPVP